MTLCDLFYFISTFRFICLFICLFFHIFFIHRILRWRSERKEKKLNRFDFIRFTSIALLKIKKKQPINLLLFNLIEFLSKRKKKEIESDWLMPYYCCWPIARSIHVKCSIVAAKCRENQTVHQPTKNYDNPFIWCLLSGMFVIQMDNVCVCVRACKRHGFEISSPNWMRSRSAHNSIFQQINQKQKPNHQHNLIEKKNTHTRKLPIE